jgi:hypothetical protein
MLCQEGGSHLPYPEIFFFLNDAEEQRQGHPSQIAEQFSRILPPRKFFGAKILKNELLGLGLQGFEEDFLQQIGLLTFGLEKLSLSTVEVQKDLAGRRIFTKLE